MSPSVEVRMESHNNNHHFNDDPLMKGDSDEFDITETSDGQDDLNESKRGEHITEPGEHDVLLGRGGGTNNHSGNIKFRKLVNEHKMRYLACSKVEKPKVAREVVQLWRKLDPPGRFLARVDESKRGPGSVKAADNVWYEVGDKKAREKASQCLRERTPDVIPYIKHLREQQNAITEQGVSLVQQQMQLQEQSQAGFSIHGMQPAFPRRNSMPVPPQGMMGRPGVPMPNRRGSLPMQPGAGFRRPMPQQMAMAQQAYGMYDMTPEEEFAFSEMTEMEYQQHMMMMQQQMQMQQQQMQMRRMQQQQQQQRMRMQQAAMAGNMDCFEGGSRRGGPRNGAMGGMGMEPLAVESAGLGRSSGHRQPQQPQRSAEAAARLPQQQPKGALKSAMMNPRRRRAGPPQQAPESTLSGGRDVFNLQPADPNSEENELSLEEYRQQLEEYISNSQNNNNNNNIHSSDVLGSNELNLKAVVADDDDDNASDLEDDWEKEKEKAYRQLKERNQSEKQRGVNRNVSGLSAMSGMTKGSVMGMSLVSGFSGLSDMMSTNTDNQNVRETKMNMARSVSSNLSLMSELTDLSQNIDNLSLYDEE